MARTVDVSCLRVASHQDSRFSCCRTYAGHLNPARRGCREQLPHERHVRGVDKCLMSRDHFGQLSTPVPLWLAHRSLGMVPAVVDRGLCKSILHSLRRDRCWLIGTGCPRFNQIVDPGVRRCRHATMIDAKPALEGSCSRRRGCTLWAHDRHRPRPALWREYPSLRRACVSSRPPYLCRGVCLHVGAIAANDR